MNDLELVVLDVAAGTAMESQSGLQMNRPRIYGALAGPSKGRVGAIVMHPTSNFMGHYLMEPFAKRGIGLLALNSRFAGNDSVLVMERVIQDLGAGVTFMRERFDTVFLIGNSGGASGRCARPSARCRPRAAGRRGRCGSGHRRGCRGP